MLIIADAQFYKQEMASGTGIVEVFLGGILATARYAVFWSAHLPYVGLQASILEPQDPVRIKPKDPSSRGRLILDPELRYSQTLLRV